MQQAVIKNNNQEVHAKDVENSPSIDYREASKLDNASSLGVSNLSVLSNDLFVSDIDGSIVDTSDPNVEAYSYGFRMMSLPAPPEDQIISLIGTSPLEAIEKMDARKDLNEETRKIMYEKHVKPAYERSLPKKARLYDGATGVLKQIKDYGGTLAAHTSAPSSVQIPLLETLGLLEYFEKVQTDSNSPYKKPDPESLNHLISRFDKKFDSVWYLDDIGRNIDMAKRCGANTIFCSYGFEKNKNDVKSDYTVNSISDVKSIFS